MFVSHIAQNFSFQACPLVKKKDSISGICTVVMFLLVIERKRYEIQYVCFPLSLKKTGHKTDGTSYEIKVSGISPNTILYKRIVKRKLLFFRFSLGINDVAFSMKGTLEAV